LTFGYRFPSSWGDRDTFGYKMARPIKNNADYFPHDADMRNDPKVKAVRRKFGVEGYGIYSMLIELLTDSEYFQFKNDSLSIEIVAGDFDISPDRLAEILRYLCQIDLIQIDAETQLIKCKSLENRLNPLLSKRKRDREGVIDSENTQSKVKESILEKKKENKSKENAAEAEVIIWPSFEDFWNLYDKKEDRPKCEKKWKKISQGAREKIMIHVDDYVKETPDKQYRKHPSTYLNNESWNNEIIAKQNGKPIFNPSESAKRIDEMLRARENN
jgi:hypothetical protein